MDDKPGAGAAPELDHPVARFIERFSSTLVGSGMPRMPARVFAALLVSESGRLTSAELSELLRVSPAAVSGAVRYLDQVDILVREREPGTRRDVYHLYDDVWEHLLSRRTQALVRWVGNLREGVDAVGAHSPAAARLADTISFLEFVGEEVPAVIARWKEQRARRRAQELR